MDAPGPTGHSARPTWRELLGAWSLVTGVVVVVNALATLSPFVADNGLAAVALAFVAVPLMHLDRRGLDPADYGMHVRGLGRQLRAAGWTVLVVFPLFCAGYHVWATAWRHSSPHLDEYVVARWPLETRGTPPRTALRHGEVVVWTVRETVYAWWWLDEPVEAVVRSPEGGEPLRVRRLAPLVAAGRHAGSAVRVERWGRGGAVRAIGKGPVGIAVHAGRRREVALRFLVGGKPVGEDRIRLGRYLASASLDDDGALRLRRSWAWLWLMLLTHLVAVAIPEEVFFRGYLQTRFDELWPPQLRLLGARVGPALVVASAMFALTHWVGNWNPGRLAVFFPALLFGWLRARTDSVGAPAVVHALSNVLLALLQGIYPGT